MDRMKTRKFFPILQFGWQTEHLKLSLVYSEQLYTVHALVGGTYPFRDGHLLPSIYILLPGKSSSYYRKMRHIIQQLCPGSIPRYLLVDFEKDAINTFAEVWPRTYIKVASSIYHNPFIEMSRI